MDAREQRVICQYAGGSPRVALLLDRESSLPDRVELYVWKEKGLLALVGTDRGAYRVHRQDVWESRLREVIYSTRLGEYLMEYFPNGPNDGRLELEAWFDEGSGAVIMGRTRREELEFGPGFRQVDLREIFRAKVLSGDGLKVNWVLPMRLSGVRRGKLLELTADPGGAIACEVGYTSSYLSGGPLPRLCGDWGGLSCWGRACVDGWVIGPNILCVAHTDPLRHFRGHGAEAGSGDGLQALPELYRRFILERKAM